LKRRFSGKREVPQVQSLPDSGGDFLFIGYQTPKYAWQVIEKVIFR